MATQIYYRIRIRAADDLSDALVVSSAPGGTNPYLVKQFRGDGRSIDPLAGTVTTGSYNIEVIDAVTAANTRVVTASLADANARQQLLSRRAYGESSPDGSAWTGVFGGYVNAIRLTRPLCYEIAIGETRRLSNDRDIFKSTVLKKDYAGTPTSFSVFDKTTCIFGGPIRGGWLWVRDLGGWRFKVNQAIASPKYVQMKLIRAFDPRKPEMGTWSHLSNAIVDYMCKVASPYYREQPTWKSVGIRGSFPGILYRVQSTTGTLIGNYTPLSEPTHPDKATPPDIFTRPGEASIWLQWTGTLPTVGDLYDVYMFPTDISTDNPLHIYEHPVDLRQKIWDELGVGYDASVLPALRSLIGDQIRVALRISQSPGKVKDFEAILNGIFGMGTRSNGAGQEVLFSHRIKLATSPGSTITVNDLRDSGGTVFELDESTIVNKVTIQQRRLTQRIQATAASPIGDDPTADSVIEIKRTVSVENSATDIGYYGGKEIVYDLPGMIVADNSRPEWDFEKYTLGLAREIFDRYGRGAVGGEIHCLPNVTVDVGQEVIVNIPQLPNAVVGASPVSQRGGNRIVQVTRRTETPGGPDLYVLDSGTTAQAATAPTFTIALNADDGFHFADVVITNAATLAAAGYFVRVEMAVGAGTPTTGTLHSNIDPSAVTSFTIPAHDSGTKVWVRMRSEKEGYRPSAWTSFAGQQLTTLNAVTGLAVSVESAGDPSRRTLSWTIGANATDYPVEVLLRLTADATTADRLIAILPKGSTQYVLEDLDIANRTATVRHRERAPLNGVSADSTIAVNTTLAAITLAAPTNPVGFSSAYQEVSAVRLPPGSYGIDVNAAVFPGRIEIAVAVGAGAFETREVVDAVPHTRTRWMSTAPNDGQTRSIKARHVGQGYTPSPYCSTVTVNPWVGVALWRHVFNSDGQTQLIDVTAQQIQQFLKSHRLSQFNDGDYATRATNNTGLLLHSGVLESGSKAVNRLLGKALAGDPDNADSVLTGLTNKAVPLTVINGNNEIATRKLTGAGSTPTLSNVQAFFNGTNSITGSDAAGKVTLNKTTASSTQSNGHVFKVTFAVAYATAPFVFFSSDTSFGWLLGAISTTDFWIDCNASILAGGTIASTTIVTYGVIG